MYDPLLDEPPQIPPPLPPHPVSYNGFQSLEEYQRQHQQQVPPPLPPKQSPGYDDLIDTYQINESPIQQRTSPWRTQEDSTKSRIAPYPANTDPIMLIEQETMRGEAYSSIFDQPSRPSLDGQFLPDIDPGYSHHHKPSLNSLVEDPRRSSLNNDINHRSSFRKHRQQNLSIGSLESFQGRPLGPRKAPVTLLSGNSPEKSRVSKFSETKFQNSYNNSFNDSVYNNSINVSQYTDYNIQTQYPDQGVYNQVEYQNEVEYANQSINMNNKQPMGNITNQTLNYRTSITSINSNYHRKAPEDYLVSPTHANFIQSINLSPTNSTFNQSITNTNFNQSISTNFVQSAITPNGKIQHSQSVKNRIAEKPILQEFKKISKSSTDTKIIISPEKRNSKLPPPPNNLDLPDLPFSSSSLTPTILNQCSELWSLSQIFQWCKNLPNWVKSPSIAKKELMKALQLLIQTKFPRLNHSIIEDNVETIIEEFEKHECIIYDNNDNNASINSLNILFNEDASVYGVLPQLSACYSNKVNHKNSHSNRALKKTCGCYSISCPREPLKKLNILSSSIKAPHIITQPTGLKPNGESELGFDWVDHWNLTKEELSEIDELTQQRQSHIFDLIKGEQRVVTQGRIIVDIYGESFIRAKPPLVADSDKFYEDAFTTVVPIVHIHQNFLLIPLINELKSNKFITNIARFYSAWVHEAYIPYLKYVERMVGVREIIDNYSKKPHSAFSNWLKQIDNDHEVTSRGLDHGRLFGPSFLGATMNIPITLKEILKCTPESDREYARLQSALKSVRKLINKFNTMQDNALRIKELSNLSLSLIWKNGTAVDVDWESKDRRIVKRGSLTRKRDRWVSTSLHLILLDNFLLITDEIKENGNIKKYRVIEQPINMSYLLLEIDIASQVNDNLPINNSSSIVNKPLVHNNTGSSNSVPTTPINSEPEILFTIRHIAKSDSWTFSLNNINERQEWISAIQDTQAHHFENIKKFEPFKLKILSDAAFGYDRIEKLAVYPKSSCIDLALKDLYKQFPGPIPKPLMYSKVNCGESFHYNGKEYNLVGLGYGVFLCEFMEVRKWVRVLELKNITQLKALPEFNLLVVLADKILQYYKLDSIFTVFNGIRNKTIGQKLSKQQVSFFKIGQQKGSTLLFYCKPKVSSSGSNFKVMIPKLDDTSANFEYFEYHQRFSIYAECFNLTIFNNTFSIHTVKGFEILSLQILKSRSIPELKNLITGNKIENGNVTIIEKKLNHPNCKPMGLFKINDNKELLLVYNEFAIICDNHGELSRYSILPFSFRCSKVAFQDDFLVIVAKNIIEIYRIDQNTCIPGNLNSKPIQIIASKGIELIDDNSGKIKLVMIHPSEFGRQLIVELVPNEYYKE